MNHLTYKESTAETECAICTHTIAVNSPIVELACKHIFDENCLTKTYRKCPCCNHPIENRFIYYNYQVTSKAIDELARNLIPLIPSLDQPPPTIRTQLESFKITLMLLNKNATISTDFIKVIRELIIDIPAIVLNDRVRLDEIIVRHARHFNTLLIITKYIENPIDLHKLENQVFLNDQQENLRIECEKFHTLFAKNIITRQFHDHIIAVLTKANTNPQIERCFINRKYQFIGMCREHLNTLNTIGKIRFVNNLQLHHRQIIQYIPEFKQLLGQNITKHLIKTDGFSHKELKEEK